MKMSDYIVRSVVRSGRASSNAELPALVGVHPTTTLRMLESLASRQLLRQLPDGTYDLETRTLDIGNAFLRRISISRYATEIAQMLSDEVEETASLGALDEAWVLYIAIAHGQADLGIQSVSFGRHPLYCAALSKALIADLPWTDAELLIRRLPMDKLTTKTITSLAALRKDVELTRERGWAIDDQERTPGVTCIAAPIWDYSGRVVAAVSISGPNFRIAGRGIEKLAAVVRTAARTASERLGATVCESDARRRARA
jgi:IclR family acetate operon transcriptional repressor